MEYYDKKNHRLVKLSPSESEFLVNFRDGFEGERLIKFLSNKDFVKSIKWIPRHSSSIVTFDKMALKATTFKNTLINIEDDETVKDIMTVFYDEHGFLRVVVPRRLLVAYKQETKTVIKNILEQKGFKILEMSRFGNWVVVEIGDGDSIEESIEQLNKIVEVEYCEPVYLGVDDAEDANNILKWNLQEINVAEAWEVTTGIKDILIAVIDGIPDTNHPAIQSAFINGFSADWNFSDVQTPSSHSTQIISILVGKGDHFHGISPNISLLPLGVSLKAQYYHQRAESIFYLATILKEGMIRNQKVSRIIANCSWKTSGDVGVIRNAFETAVAEGVIFVTSAGNDNSTGPHFPSDYSKTNLGVFSVAALAPNDKKATYSNYSTSVSLSAPGGAGLPFDEDDIYCADINNTNSYTAGTSFAAPHLTGTIALMLSVYPKMSLEEVWTILKETVSSLKTTNPTVWEFLGCGKLDVGKAVIAAAALAKSGSKPQNPEVPEAPLKPPVQKTRSANRPQININVSNENTNSTNNLECFLDQVLEDINDELHLISRGCISGELLRITIETKGRVTTLDRRA